MREQLLHLIDVQKIDAQIAELQHSISQYPKKMAAQEEKVVSSRKEVADLTQELEAMKKDYDERKEALKLEENKLKIWEARLVEIRNQRDYMAMSRETEGLKRQNKDENEALLELTNTIKEKQNILDGLSDDLAVLEIDFVKENDEIKKVINNTQSQISELVSVRENLLKDVNANIVKRYERIREHRKGIALAASNNSRCLGCNMNIPQNLFNTLLRVNSIETCPSCGRILYWEGILPKAEEK